MFFGHMEACSFVKMETTGGERAAIRLCICSGMGCLVPACSLCHVRLNVSTAPIHLQPDFKLCSVMRVQGRLIVKAYQSSSE